MNSMLEQVALCIERGKLSKTSLGGAPLTRESCNEIGADGYSPDPQGALDFLERVRA